MALKRELSQLQAKCDSAERAKQAMEAQLAAVQRQRDEFAVRLEAKQSELEQLRARNLALSDEQKEMAVTVSELRRELAHLKRSNLDLSQWREWGCEEVFVFVMDCVGDGGLNESEELIRANVFGAEYDGQTLEDISREEIKDMGITKVKHIRAVQTAIAQLVRGQQRQPQPMHGHGGDGADEGVDAEEAPTAYHFK